MESGPGVGKKVTFLQSKPILGIEISLATFEISFATFKYYLRHLSIIGDIRDIIGDI